jgi:predicted DNA-binding transcriptional regulator YafY
MKLERLISMIYMLLNNEVISASVLSEKYGVSQRTIYRDIDAICAAGIPVVSYHGVNGGYGIIDTYKMDRSLLGDHDINSLIAVLRSLSSAFEDDHAMDTVRKLQTIQRGADDPILDIDIGSREGHSESLSTLRTAIHEQLIVRFEYMNVQGQHSKRSVEPAGLKFRKGAWYLSGFCLGRNDFREFRLSRMASLMISTNRFERRPIPVPSGWRDFAGSTEISEDVVLRFATGSQARALDYFAHREKLYLEDGSLIVKFKLNNPADAQWLTQIMLSFGDRAEIVEPLGLRQEMKSIADKIGDLYSEV